jgi:hypothetical protein
MEASESILIGESMYVKTSFVLILKINFYYKNFLGVEFER